MRRVGYNQGVDTMLTPFFVEDTMDDEVAELLAILKNVPDKINTYDGPGRGRKQCLSCKEYVGVKTRVCVCGQDFEARPQGTKIVVDEYPKEMISFCQRLGLPNNRVCFAPSGDCETKLSELTYNGVVKYCDDVIDEYYNKAHRVLTPDAIKYTGRYGLDLTGEDLNFFELCVDEWFSTLSCEIES